MENKFEQIITPNIIRIANNIISQDIEKRREEAAYVGAWHDNGADRLRQNMDIFLSAYSNTSIKLRDLPEFLHPYILEALKINDEEYEEYLRLKTKFEG